MSATPPTGAPVEELPLADEVVLLAIEHSGPDTCACGATWDADRAFAVIARSRYASE